MSHHSAWAPVISTMVDAFVDTALRQMFQEKLVLLAHTFAGDLELRVKMIAPGFIWI